MKWKLRIPRIPRDHPKQRNIRDGMTSFNG